MHRIGKIAGNIKKYLLFYSLGVMAFGWIFGLASPGTVKEAQPHMSLFMTVFVFFMIYPMMINLDLGKLPKIAKDPKPVLLSLVYNYLVTPAVAFLLAFVFLHDPAISLGFMLVMLMPVASSSVGYTGISGGSVETATIAQAVNFLLIPVLSPLYLTLLNSKSVPVPMGSILKSILLVVVLPMILGYVTRVLIIRFAGKKKLSEIGPVLALSTFMAMFVIIGSIFFAKAGVLVSKWELLLVLAGLTLVYLVVMLALITFTDKKAGLSYEDHMGIVFLSTGKNNGTAIAIATMAFNPLVAIPAAVLPLFQIIFLVGYVNLEKKVRGYFQNSKGNLSGQIQRSPKN